MIPALLMTAFLLTALLLTAEMPTCSRPRKSGILPPRNGAGVEPQCKTRGFTLIELLVAIGIIALLIAILLPTMRRARMAAERTACQSNVRQLFVGILNYCNDNHDWYPTVAEAAGGGPFIHYPDDWIYWSTDRNLDDSPIARYLKTHGEQFKALLRCPADNFEGRKPIPAVAPGQGAYLYSYSINVNIGENLTPPQWWRTKRGQWRRPSEKILLTEARFSIPYPVWGYVDPLTSRHGKSISKRTGAPMGENASAAFMDGHVQGINEDFSNDIRQIRPEQ